nr:hypothetical protein [Streptomyces broussonetiae]
MGVGQLTHLGKLPVPLEHHCAHPCPHFPADLFLRNASVPRTLPVVGRRPSAADLPPRRNRALMHGPDLPGGITDAHDQLHTTLIGRIEVLLASLAPDAAPADVTRTAHVCLGIYKAGLELVLTHEGAERTAYVQEIKDVLVRYLEPLVGDRLGHG